MILADKIIQLRKKCGWSQEELAEKMGVSRQSVSKWEGALSVPDLDKILLMSRIFGVSTDYLLKDEIEEAEYFPQEDMEEDSGTGTRRVPMEEASAFLAAKRETAPRIALGVLLCILSPICLLSLGGLSDEGAIGISENLAAGIGLIVLLLMVIPAVVLFVSSGMKTNRFEYLDNEPIELEYGVSGMVKERQNQLRDAHTRDFVIGVCLCIVAAIPLLLTAILTENDTYVVLSLCTTIVIVGIGVYMLVRNGIIWESTEKLLQEGDYSKSKKKANTFSEAVGAIYWCVVTAIFLFYSLYTMDWSRSWIIWPVAGVLFGAIEGIIMLSCKNKQ